MNVSRFVNQTQINLDVEFLTPCFLGGADQNAELRSAPFKALLRQWWRIANGNLNIQELHTKEREIFGGVGEKSNASLVKVSILPTANFGIEKGASFPRFGEGSFQQGARNLTIPYHSYLGYGPTTINQKKAIFPRDFIKPSSTASLKLVFPSKLSEEIEKVLKLINAFGTLGSRCRNGFGSISFSSSSKNIDLRLTKEVIQNINFWDAKKPYPHCMSKDNNGPLIWEHEAKDWNEAMKTLASTYISLRKNIQLENGDRLSERHILGYPVTGHKVDTWRMRDGPRVVEGRMPSQIRLMVKRGENGLVARICRFPHRIPKQWTLNTPEEAVWSEVHKFLDEQNGFQRWRQP